MNTISEQKISHVTDVYVTADLYQASPDKPQNRLAFRNKHAVDLFTSIHCLFALRAGI